MELRKRPGIGLRGYRHAAGDGSAVDWEGLGAATCLEPLRWFGGSEPLTSILPGKTSFANTRYIGPLISKCTHFIRHVNPVSTGQIVRPYRQNQLDVG